MTVVESIATAGDFYVPAFEMRLRGRPVAKDVVRDVISVTYKDSVAEIDSFEVVINNWDAEQRQFKYSDDTLFDPGAEVELSLGYRGRTGLQQMITGEITALKPAFPSGGQPTLAVSGLNLLHRFRGEQESHAYTDKTDSEIAEEIGTRAKIDVRTDPVNEPRHPYLVQDSVYNLVFLMERARANGYDLVVEEPPGAPRRLYFGPSTQIRRANYRLVYGGSLVEFQPNLTTANQVGEVVVRGWDPIKKEKIEYRATLAELATQGLGAGVAPGVQKSFEDRKEIVATKVVESQAEARRLAIETLQQIAKGLVTATGSTVGLPKLRAGSVIEVGGLGERFSGRYFVTDTTHAVGDSGYTTQFGCRREEVKGS
jgi:phage protein D